MLHQVLRHKAGDTQAGEGCFFGEIHPKNPVWRILRRDSPVLFLFPGALSVLVGGSSDFDSVLNKCHVMKIVYIIY